MQPSISGIYQIRNIVTGDRYIGSSVQVATRWNQHRNLLRKGAHPSAPLQLAWHEHGEDSFEFLVIEECAKDELAAKEQSHIDALGSYNSAAIASRGPLGRTRTEDQRARMSEGMRGVPHLMARGSKREFTPERIEKMRVAALNRKVPPRTGWHHSEETKAKCGTANVGNSHASGKRTPEQVERIRQGQLNRSEKRFNPAAVAASA